jgi:replicative DNA helicase
MITIDNQNIPPRDIEAERNLLGIAMRDDTGHAVDLIASHVQPEYFYDPSHQKIYQVVYILRIRREPIDIVSVVCELKNRGSIAQVGGCAYLVEILNAAPDPDGAPIAEYATSVREAWQLRELQKLCRTLIADSYEDACDVEALLDAAQQNLFDIAHGRIRLKLETIEMAAARVFGELFAARSISKKGPQ